MKIGNKDGMCQVKRLFSALFAVALVFSATGMVLADSEPNDSIYQAESIFDGSVYTGSLNEYTDVRDYYKIYLNAGETLSVTMTGTGDDFDLELYNSDEWEVDSSSGFDSSESISYYVYSAGYYYIVPYAWSGTGTYTLSVDVTGGGSPSPDPDPTPDPDDYWVGGDSYVTGEPLFELPTPTVGSSVFFGGIQEISREQLGPDIDQALAEIESMGFDVSYDIAGGVGAYFGVEIISNTADVNGHTCYDYQLTGAVAIDLGLEGSVDGSISEYGVTMSIDGSGSGYVEFEATLDGHIYFTVDEMALAGIELTLTANGHAEANIDATANYAGQNMNMDASITADIDDAQIDFDLTFDPPLDVFQFPIWEGKEWYVPPVDTDVSGSLTGSGTISYDYDVSMAGETPQSDSDTINLATEIGTNSFFETIEGGEPEFDYYSYSYVGGALFTCSYAAGNVFIIETSLGDAIGMIDTSDFLPATRQFDIGSYEDMLPSTGMQMDSSTGMVTGMTMDGEEMTSTATESEVNSFVADPLGEVVDETGGHGDIGGSSPLLLILVVVVILIVVIVVVLVVVKRKKTPPAQQYPQQEQYPQQGYTQQPQYYQQPPPPPQDQGHYPPPPPPPGQ